MQHSSTWQAHKAKECEHCWYCEQRTGSPTLRVLRFAQRTRPRFGKAGRKELKRLLVLRRRIEGVPSYQ
jgi:hypothetical protein